MPNHVTNEIIFRDVNEAEQARILSKLCNADGWVDFEILLPMPLNIWQFSACDKTEKTFKKTWYKWSIENWGTKWNAYDCLPIVQTETSLTIVFSTAWECPYPWLAAVYNSLKLSFEHNWISEYDDIVRCGEFIWVKEDNGFLTTERWREEEATDDIIKKRLYFLRYGVE